MIEIKGLTKYFYPRLNLCKDSSEGFILNVLKRYPRTPAVALEDVSLSLQKGEVLGLVGPNGAGKTTLLKILATLILPDQGEAKVNGYNILSQPEAVKKSIGLANGEERSFYWRLTGQQNLEFFGAFYNLSLTDIHSRIRELINLLPVDILNKRVGEYSAGMRQRLNIARALLHNPAVLLMDEPTKSLDPASGAELRRFIRDELSRGQGKTILLATHNINEMEEVCDRVVVLDKGKLVAQGLPSEVKNNKVLLPHA